MPWMRLVSTDLAILHKALPRIFANLHPPGVDVTPYWDIVNNYPTEWREIVSEYFDSNDDAASSNCLLPGFEENPHIERRCFQCDLCEAATFATAKALDQHRRIKHERTSVISSLVPDTSVCRICSTDFFSRARLISHLSDKRIRSKTRGTNCHFQFLARPGVELSRQERTRLQEIQRQDVREARKSGHTHVIAVRPAVRTEPSVLKGIKRRARESAGPVVPIARRRLTYKQPRPEAYSLFEG